MAAGFAIDAGRQVLQCLSHEQARNAAREFHHLDAALHLGTRLGDGLAVFARHQRGQLLETCLQPFAEANRTRARSTAGVSLQAGKASAAARTARSISAGVQNGTSA